jgi:hypothetical protein
LKTAADDGTMWGMNEFEDALPYEEEVDGLPILADVRPIEPVQPTALPAVPAAAAAATGFVAGAATVALVMRRSARRLARVQGGLPPGENAIGGVRTFLVHVHVLGRPGE